MFICFYTFMVYGLYRYIENEYMNKGIYEFILYGYLDTLIYLSLEKLETHGVYDTLDMWTQNI